jgi:hypothetical protein
MQVIKNYKLNKKAGKVEEFPAIKIKEDEDVFVELPLCICEYEKEYEEPFLFSSSSTVISVVLEKTDLLEKIKNTKLFYLKVLEDGKVQETKKEQSDFSYRLPTNTLVEDLAIVNGQLGLLEKDKRGEVNGEN